MSQVIPPPQTSYSPGLANLIPEMPTVNQVWFNQKELHLDGYKFVGCRFDGCKLHLSSTNFSLTRCKIDDTTVIFFNGKILNIIRLYNIRNQSAHMFAPDLSPVRHGDGTISILS